MSSNSCQKICVLTQSKPCEFNDNFKTLNNNFELFFGEPTKEVNFIICDLDNPDSKLKEISFPVKYKARCQPVGLVPVILVGFGSLHPDSQKWIENISYSFNCSPRLLYAKVRKS